MLRAISGLREVADDFDGFILDLWGLIHDGETLYPPTLATMRALKEKGKKTLLLSNAPRRAQALIDTMARMGLPRELYDDVLSSGDATREALIKRDDPFFARLERRAYHLGPARDRSVLDDTGFEIAQLAQADFVLNTGPRELDETVDDYREELTAAARRRLPMVCANPDIVVIRAGEIVVCAGALAARYAEMGGEIAYRGKPDPAIYLLALTRLGLPAGGVGVVGDALETDVKGARAAGLRAIWCTGGIHAAALDTCYGVPADPEKATALAVRMGAHPDTIISGFCW